MDSKEAMEIYNDLRLRSSKFLLANGMQHSPLMPHARLRPFSRSRKSHPNEEIFPSEGTGIPKGILYHFTGGRSGIKSLRWGNDARWGNTVSSWHATIFDGLSVGLVADYWDRVSSDLKKIFPAPVIINAGWFMGTYHGGPLMNAHTLGFEAVNSGMYDANNIHRRIRGKALVPYGDYLWEPYTGSQLTSIVNLSILANSLFNLNKNYILGHQCVCAIKSDPGPSFPIHSIRDFTINSDDFLEQGTLLSPCDTNSEDGSYMDEEDEWFEPSRDFRGDYYDAVIPVSQSSADKNSKSVYYEKVKTGLMYLGFCVSGKESDMVRNIKWFQSSTHDWKTSKKYRHYRPLKVDGIAGRRTIDALNLRFKQLGLSYRSAL